MLLKFFFDETILGVFELKEAYSLLRANLNGPCFINMLAQNIKNLCLSNPEDIFFQINIVSDNVMQNINHRFRNEKKSTDVLTFTFPDYSKRKDIPLGEVYISLDVALEQAKERNIPLSSELTVLSVHGILHSLGFDHEISHKDRALMMNKEKEFLLTIGLSQGLSLI